MTQFDKMGQFFGLLHFLENVRKEKNETIFAADIYSFALFVCARKHAGRIFRHNRIVRKNTLRRKNCPAYWPVLFFVNPQEAFDKSEKCRLQSDQKRNPSVSIYKPRRKRKPCENLNKLKLLLIIYDISYGL